MSPQSLADKTYGIILNRMIETGVAPHYTEIAQKLRVAVPDGRKALFDLAGLKIPGIWLFPDTDLERVERVAGLAHVRQGLGVGHGALRQ